MAFGCFVFAALLMVHASPWVAAVRLRGAFRMEREWDMATTKKKRRQDAGATGASLNSAV
jgi:hypothetical protein